MIIFWFTCLVYKMSENGLKAKDTHMSCFVHNPKTFTLISWKGVKKEEHSHSRGDWIFTLSTLAMAQTGYSAIKIVGNQMNRWQPNRNSVSTRIWSINIATFKSIKCYEGVKQSQHNLPKINNQIISQNKRSSDSKISLTNYGWCTSNNTLVD